MDNQLVRYFASLRSEAQVKEFVAEKREEDLHLEFKEKANPSHGNIDTVDRTGFSKTVSGFANADGGILIFGVRTEKSRDNPDHAVKVRPIAEPERFRAKLLDSILNTTQPPVDGVVIEVVLGAAGRGYVKCLVPPSDRPPHRAMYAEQAYWRRTTNGNRRMDHYELEDVFGRRLRPVLRVGVKLHLRDDPDPHEELRLTFLNEGRGLARHAGLLCRLREGKIAGTSGQLNDISALNQNRPMAQYYDSHSVIHPNGIYSSLGVIVLTRPTKGRPLPLSIKWYAENMAPRDESFEVTAGPEGILVT